jgi:hypothetical protein
MNDECGTMNDELKTKDSQFIISLSLCLRVFVVNS